MTRTLRQVYNRLLEAFGPQDWWPGESPFEVLVGAVLVQNTAWKNVEKAIANLREQGLLSPEQLNRLPDEELAELVRPAGYFRQKTARLRNLINFIFDKYDGSLETMFATDLETLRAQLLGIHGIGPETADSILLYAGSLATFVVDTYTSRVLKRHGWIEYEADYHAIKEYFESHLETDPQLFNEYHALLVKVGHEYCRKTPKCDACPLVDLLPSGGVQDPESK